jgi:ApaG protein
VTAGVRVVVQPRYCVERSDPKRGHWFFLYTVLIANDGPATVQLVSRHWTITDAYGETEEVRGPGVVGEQPLLRPGQSFEYTSGCPLRTPFGGMAGEYQMVDQDGRTFEVKIPAFVLRNPASMQ